nr:MAG TPA: hypothetical protein [Crassvirales sp.]
MLLTRRSKSLPKDIIYFLSLWLITPPWLLTTLRTLGLYNKQHLTNNSYIFLISLANYSSLATDNPKDIGVI